jgi:hypothetical protein
MLYLKQILLVTVVCIYSCGTIHNKQTYKSYQKIALCECVLSNYNRLIKDTFRLNDVSKSVIFLESKIPYENVKVLDSFVQANTANYYKSSFSHTSTQDSSFNEILNLCIEFSNSKQLKQFYTNKINK